MGEFYLNFTMSIFGNISIDIFTSIILLWVWATENEIFGAASMLNTTIFLFSQFGAQHVWSEYMPIDDQPRLSLNIPRNSSMFLNHSNDNHFEPVFNFA